MATIRSIFSPGTTFNVLDPNAWVGGVVPGPNDIAQIGENGNYRTAINMSSPYSTLEPPTKNGGAYILPWTDNETTIRVDDNNTNYNSEYEFPNTDGSFLVYINGGYPLLEFPVKIDYVSKSLDNNDYFYSCSVDYSYGSNWTYKTGSTIYNGTLTPLGYHSESFGYIADDQFVYPLETEFELTGSQVWHVGQIETLERCHLTIKDNAHLKLDGTTVNPNAIYNDSDSYNNVIRILDNVTIQVTGSVQRAASGIYYSNRDSYNRIQISGSDNCVNTTLGSSTNIGDSKLTLSDATGFGEGDIISIDHTNYPMYYTRNLLRTGSRENEPGKTSKYYHYFGMDLTFPSGNMFNNQYLSGQQYVDHDFEDIEVVQIISQSGNESTVAQLYGKEGIVYEDLGLYNHEQFVQTFGGTPPSFMGNKRVVLTNSAHKNFKAGDNIIISRSLVTDILYEDYYLSASTEYDFTNDATIEGTFHMPEYRLTGSFLPPTSSWYQGTTQQSGNNVFYGKERFDLNNNILVSEMSHSLNGEVTRSAHLRSQDTEIYAADNPQTTWSAFVTNSYDFHEGEVEIEYNFYRYRYGAVTQSYNDYDTSTRFSLTLGNGRGRGCAIAVSPDQGSYFPSTTENFLGINRYQDQFTTYGQDRSGYTYRTYAISGSSDYVTGSTPDRWPGARDGLNEKVKLTHKQGISEIYYNDQLINKFTGNLDPGPIFVGGYRYLKIYNIKVSKYYQLLLLDTDESVSKNDNILEGAYLQHNHTLGQRVRSNANKIKNALGHTNLFYDYVENPETNIRPYMHGQTTTQNEGEGNYYNYYRQSDGGNGLITQGPNAYGANPEYRKTGTGFYIVWDLQTEVSMSAFSMNDYYGYDYDYMERAGEPVTIEVSNDINSIDPWTEVYSANDPRLTSRMMQHRFYHFTSGSTSARFIKLSLNGNSRETSNVIGKVGIHNFYDSSGTDLGNSIELYNADNFDVGDTVYFFNYKNAQPRITVNNDDSGGIVNLESQQIVPNIIGNNLTDADVAGGLSIMYNIIAKSGNRITLDRTMASYNIGKDTVVYKWNQGGINLTGDYKNFPNLYIYRSSNTYVNPSQIRGLNHDFARDSYAQLANQNNSYASEFRDNSVYTRLNRNPYFGSNVMSNCIIVGGSTHNLQYYNTDTQRRFRFDSIAYNNHVSTMNLSVTLQSSNMLQYSNRQLYTLYNSVYRSRENSTYYGLYPSEQTLQDCYDTPRVKMNNNYLAGVSRNPVLNYIRSFGYDDKLTPKTIEIKNNYNGYGYSSQDQDRDFAKQRERSYSQLLVNPNIEIDPFETMYHQTTNNYIFNWISNRGWFADARFDSFNTPIKRHNAVLDKNFVAWSTAEQNSSILYKPNNNLNRYVISPAVYPNNINNTLRQQGTYTGYVCQFMLDTDQDIQIILDFNYKMNTLGPYFGSNQSNTNNYINYFDEYFWLPKVALIDNHKMILDSEFLNFTQTNTQFSYNKTFSLQKGTYSFFLNKINNQNVNGHAFEEWLEHGPIDLQLYTNDPNPNNVRPLSNNWEAYKILEGENIYPKDKNNKRGNMVDSLIRPVSNLPLGNIKFRKVKL